MMPQMDTTWTYLDELMAQVPGLAAAAERYQLLCLQNLGKASPVASYLDWPDSEIVEMTAGDGGLLRLILEELANTRFEQPSDVIIGEIAELFRYTASVHNAMAAVQAAAEPTFRYLLMVKLRHHLNRLMFRWLVYKCREKDCIGFCEPKRRFGAGLVQEFQKWLNRPGKVQSIEEVTAQLRREVEQLEHCLYELHELVELES